MKFLVGKMMKPKSACSCLPFPGVGDDEKQYVRYKLGLGVVKRKYTLQKGYEYGRATNRQI